MGARTLEVGGYRGADRLEGSASGCGLYRLPWPCSPARAGERSPCSYQSRLEREFSRNRTLERSPWELLFLRCAGTLKSTARGGRLGARVVEPALRAISQYPAHVRSASHAYLAYRHATSSSAAHAGTICDPRDSNVTEQVCERRRAVRVNAVRWKCRGCPSTARRRVLQHGPGLPRSAMPEPSPYDFRESPSPFRQAAPAVAVVAGRRTDTCSAPVPSWPLPEWPRETQSRTNSGRRA